MANTFHVALYVDSVPEAVAQYRKLLGIEPAKVRHDYAKFELQDPPVILSLNAGGEPGKLSHLGIRYGSTGEVASEMVRVKQAEVPLFQQEGTTCCYAKADKFWVRDGDGDATAARRHPARLTAAAQQQPPSGPHAAAPAAVLR